MYHCSSQGLGGRPRGRGGDGAGDRVGLEDRARQTPWLAACACQYEAAPLTSMLRQLAAEAAAYPRDEPGPDERQQLGDDADEPLPVVTHAGTFAARGRGGERCSPSTP